MEWKGIMCILLPPVYVFNLYWGQWFIQIDFFELKCSCFRYAGFFCPPICVLLSSLLPYLHNDIQYKVMTSYAAPTGTNGQRPPWLLSFCPVLLHCTFTHVSISVLTETSSFGSVLCRDPIAWISAGSVHFCKPQTCWTFTFLYVTTCLLLHVVTVLFLGLGTNLGTETHLV